MDEWKPLIRIMEIFLIAEVIFGIGGIAGLGYSLEGRSSLLVVVSVFIYAFLMSIFIGRTITFIGEKMEQVESI